MLPAFANAFLVRPPSVLGVRLLPFSLGHAYILDATESPFAMHGEKPVGLSDLCMAVQVCSRPFRDALEFCMTGAGVDAEVWATECAGANLADETATFCRYLGSYHTLPKRWSKQGDKPARAPWMLQLAAAVMGDGALCGQAMEDALNMPLSEALILTAARAAYQGDESIMSETEAQAVEQLKAMQESDNGAS